MCQRPRREMRTVATREAPLLTRSASASATLAGREASRAITFDLGFGLGPRLNAAGRLADMSLGIECLLTDDANRAWEIAQELDGMNRERRDIEAGMQQEAMQILEQADASARLNPAESIRLLQELLEDSGAKLVPRSAADEPFHFISVRQEVLRRILADEQLLTLYRRKHADAAAALLEVDELEIAR